MVGQLDRVRPRVVGDGAVGTDEGHADVAHVQLAEDGRVVLGKV